MRPPSTAPRTFRLLALCASCLLLLQGHLPGFSAPKPSGMAVLTVASFNLRYDNSEDRERGRAWPDRQGLVASLLSGFDVAGTQEGLPAQLADIDGLLPGFARVGQGRGWLGSGEHCAIFLKDSAVSLISEGTFGLSERPECLSTKGWGAACPRIATYAVLGLPDGNAVVVANLHLDHVSAEARVRGAELVAARVSELEASVGPALAGSVVLGDFNVPQRDAAGRPGEVFAAMEHAGFRSACGAASGTLPPLSFHNWRGWDGGGACGAGEHEHIDWILWKGPRLLPRRFWVLTDKAPGGLLPSDHFPVAAAFGLLPPPESGPPAASA